jgi:hypothetical protein
MTTLSEPISKDHSSTAFKVVIWQSVLQTRLNLFTDKVKFHNLRLEIEFLIQ